MVAEVSQNTPFVDMLAGGETPVFTTSASLWVFQAGEVLNVKQLAALMGVDMSTIKWSKSMQQTRFQRRLGLAIHIGNLSLVLMAVLAPPLRASLL